MMMLHRNNPSCDRKGLKNQFDRKGLEGESIVK